MNSIRLFALTVTLAAAPFAVMPIVAAFLPAGPGAIERLDIDAPCRAKSPNDIAMAKASAAIRRRANEMLAGDACSLKIG